MRAGWIVTVAAGAALGLMPPAELAAQGASASARAGQQARPNQEARGQQQRASDRAREAERVRADRERERIRAERERARQGGSDTWGQQQRNNAGPAFCRSGAGHPVHGRDWCRSKGFGLGTERWDRGSLGDIIFGDSRDRDRRRNDRRLDRRGLGDVLGDVVLGRFESYGSRHGSGPISGQWFDDRDGAVLQLMIGGVPFASLVDVNRNGRVDQVLLRR
jgi:hypothetical protein